MRVVFMARRILPCRSLRELASRFEVVLVLTRPDAVRSRGKKLEPSPVKAAALELDIPVMEATRITPEVMDRLHEAEADIFCVAAYGCILPDEVLHMAPLGIVNVHASLLPRWRGAAPIQRAILAGDERAGISIMRIGHGVDTGAYCAQASCSVAGKTADELTAVWHSWVQTFCAILFRPLPMRLRSGPSKTSPLSLTLRRSLRPRCVWTRRKALLSTCVACSPLLMRPLHAALLPGSPCASCVPKARMGLLPFVPR